MVRDPCRHACPSEVTGGASCPASEGENQPGAQGALGDPRGAFDHEAAVEVAPGAVVTRREGRDPEASVEPDTDPVGLRHVLAARADRPGEAGIAPEPILLEIEDADAERAAQEGLELSRGVYRCPDATDLDVVDGESGAPPLPPVERPEVEVGILAEIGELHGAGFLQQKAQDAAPAERILELQLTGA